MPSEPKLSVVVTTREDDPQALAQCLEAVDRLVERSEIEIVVTPMAVGESLAHARARGIADCKGDLIAVLGERYRVDGNWARAILDAHHSDCGVVSGCVGPPASSSLVAWSIFLWEYIHAAPPMTSGPLARADAILSPGGNTSYKRKALQALDMAVFRWELDYHAALFTRGVGFVREATMLVRYEPPPLRRFLAERFWLSYGLAGDKAAGLSGIRRCAMAALRLALPLWLMAKIVAQTFRKWRYAPRAILCFPLLVCYASIQTAGELAAWLGVRRDGEG